MATESEATLGAEGPRFTWTVEAGKVAEFARACLDVHTAAAGAVPLTFPTVASHFWEPPGARVGLARPFELARLLHGEQEYQYSRPLHGGDVLTGSTRLADYYTKRGQRGGEMRFAVYETAFHDSAGRHVATARSTLIETERPAHE